MRQIFSIRFFAAIAAVLGLFGVLYLLFADRDVDVPAAEPVATVPLRDVDFVDWIYESSNPEFMVVAGRAAADTEFVIDGSRRLTVRAGTLAEQHCPEFGQIVKCAFLADLLGEAVVWVAIVPMNPNRTVDLPAIDTLDEGIATLVNGWQMPYKPILDRICGDDYDFASYRELRESLGDEFIAVYSIDAQRLVAVECGQRVDYAPSVPVATAAPSSGPASAPASAP